jgi:hypothetical protein
MADDRVSPLEEQRERHRRLDGLPEAHLIREQRASRSKQKRDAIPLVFLQARRYSKILLGQTPQMSDVEGIRGHHYSALGLASSASRSGNDFTRAASKMTPLFM